MKNKTPAFYWSGLFFIATFLIFNWRADFIPELFDEQMRSDLLSKVKFWITVPINTAVSLLVSWIVYRSFKGED